MRKGHGHAPVVQQFVRERLFIEERPDRSLETVSPDHLACDLPLTPNGLIRPRAVGVHLADPEADELHRGFIPALPELVGFFGRYEPGSPGRAEPVVAKPEDLSMPSGFSETELRIVGHLLEVEGIGEVSWTEDPASPWRIELGLEVLRYRRVVVFADFVRVLQSRVPSGTGD